MAFDRTKTNQRTDRMLGKPYAATEAPWIIASPKQNERTALKRKAEEVRAGSSKFTSEELNAIVADLILSGE